MEDVFLLPETVLLARCLSGNVDAIYDGPQVLRIFTWLVDGRHENIVRFPGVSELASQFRCLKGTGFQLVLARRYHCVVFGIGLGYVGLVGALLDLDVVGAFLLEQFGHFRNLEHVVRFDFSEAFAPERSGIRRQSGSVFGVTVRRCGKQCGKPRRRLVCTIQAAEAGIGAIVLRRKP